MCLTIYMQMMLLKGPTVGTFETRVFNAARPPDPGARSPTAWPFKHLMYVWTRAGAPPETVGPGAGAGIRGAWGAGARDTWVALLTNASTLLDRRADGRPDRMGRGESNAAPGAWHAAPPGDLL